MSGWGVSAGADTLTGRSSIDTCDTILDALDLEFQARDLGGIVAVFLRLESLDVFASLFHFGSSTLELD